MDKIMTWVMSTLGIILISVAIIWLWERKQIFNTWKRLGVPGPPITSFFLGNLNEAVKQGRHTAYKSWTQKYGKVFGYFEGAQPILVVSDPDIVKEILVKQFECFPQRHRILDNSDDKFASIIDTYGDKWKRVRGVSASTFTGKKIKLMFPLVQESINKLLSYLEDNKDFDISTYSQRLMLDILASSIFSFQCDAFSPENIFLMKLQQLFDTLDITKISFTKRFLLSVFRIFPSWLRIAKLFQPRVSAMEDEWFLKLAKKMILERQSSGEVRNDYIQLMLDVNMKQAHREEPTDTKSEATQKFLTMEEMQSSTFIFIAAGYETTAATLTLVVYYLAVYPDIQAKLHQEIEKYFPGNSNISDFESVEQLPYLDMVFCEVSRLASLAPLAIHRECRRSTQIASVTIPKGVTVAPNMVDIHMNPDLWGPEPVDQLVPERFLPERKASRHPMAYLPFGAGPRNCIAVRFANLEVKTAVIQILQRYFLIESPNTPTPLKIKSDGLHAPAEEVFVKLVKRC